MDELPRPADWVHEPGERQVVRGVVAVAALIVGVAVLAVAAVLITRHLAETRALAPTQTTTLSWVPSDTTTGTGAPVTTAAEEPETGDAPHPTFVIRPLLVDVAPETVHEVIDDTGTLRVAVPLEWTDTATSAWMRDTEPVGVRINSATDRDAWFAGWGTPGAFIGVTEVLDPSSLFGDFTGECSYQGRATVDVGSVPADVDVWEDCGAEGGVLAVVVVPDLSGDGHTMLIQVIVIDEDWLGFSSIIGSVEFRP